jgi:hypothetical protein
MPGKRATRGGRKKKGSFSHRMPYMIVITTRDPSKSRSEAPGNGPKIYATQAGGIENTPTAEPNFIHEPSTFRTKSSTVGKVKNGIRSILQSWNTSSIPHRAGREDAVDTALNNFR